MKVVGSSNSVRGPEPCAWPLLPPVATADLQSLDPPNGGRAKRYWDTGLGTWVLWTSVGSSVTLSTSQCRPFNARGLQNWGSKTFSPCGWGASMLTHKIPGFCTCVLCCPQRCLPPLWASQPQPLLPNISASWPSSATAQVAGPPAAVTPSEWGSGLWPWGLT